jgi:nucleotide-binding universal stress UspA family protein
MAGTENRFTIVVGIDFSEISDAALDQALELANRHEETDVHVVFVEDELATPRVPAATSDQESESSEMLARVKRRALDRLDLLAKRATLTIRYLVIHVRRGEPAEHIVQLASHLDADIIVVGTHGRRGIERLLLGSVAERVMRLARCPVLVVRPKDHEGVGKVPEIEPPCPDCVRKRQETSGAELWCAQHSEHHIRPHTYHYVQTGLYSAERMATRAAETTPNQTHGR